VYEWFSRFKNGEMSIEDNPRSERPSTSRTDENVMKVKEIVLTDRRQIIDQILEVSGLSWSSVQRIPTEDLTMKMVTAKFVPRILTDTQKERRIETCRDLKQHIGIDPDFLSKIHQKPYNNPANGRRHCHPDQKNVVKSDRTSKQC